MDSARRQFHKAKAFDYILALRHVPDVIGGPEISGTSKTSIVSRDCVSLDCL